jgi:2-oxoglutarate dehydrogenase E2 component (dihydrolipoamide succinyltransferase)
MKIDMLMPQMGESIAEATISKWLKAAGDAVEKDEIILEISTDKVDSEIPAPASGVLSELLFGEGDVVPVKEKIATIDTNGAGAAAAPAEAAPAATPEPESTPPSQPTGLNGQAPSSSVPASSVPPASASGKFFSPLVRSLAESRGVSIEELETISGTGRGGRVTKQDLMSYLNSRGGAQATTVEVHATPQPPVPAPQPAAAPAPIAKSQYEPPVLDMPTGEWNADGTRVIGMDKMRQLIANHMVSSKQTSPHVYSVQEVDVTEVAKWRARHKSEFKRKEGFNLSFTPFFLEAAVRGLLQFPRINASVNGNTIIEKRHINLGCAVALGDGGDGGLIVPVIKHADERNLVGLSRALTDLASRARSKKLLPDEVMGGTFTVTNPGVFGTMIGTPIINQPQLAILCLGAVKKRPVVVNDAIAIRDICYLTLSYDHRVIDGSLGGQYLKFIREYLEGWDANRPLY